MMNVGRRMKTDPIPVVRQVRSIPFRATGTVTPGKFQPIGCFNLLREDSVNGNVPFAMELAPTHELLMNQVRLRVTAWFVPALALTRFDKNPTFFQKSYQGEPPMEGEAVIPFIQTAAYGVFGSNKVYEALGLYAKAETLVNTAYLESFNLIWNYVARNRSKDLTLRGVTDGTLPPAFWTENNLSEIVPDFDDALIAGEVPLTLVEQNVAVKGIGVKNQSSTHTNVNLYETGSDDETYPLAKIIDRGTASNSGDVYIEMDGLKPAIYAEMQANDIKVSLANIDQARKLVAWARLKEMYEGHSDAYIIDTLMQGFSIEEQRFMQPILLSQESVAFRQGLRWATDGENLTEKATNGIARGSINISVPQNTYGGVVMLIAEVVPEQLYERQVDPFFVATSVDDLPNYKTDVLDPMPVVQVFNDEIDPDHSAPTGLFGYARRNWKWLKWPMRVGGNMHWKGSGTANTEERKRMWPTDVANPTLSEEFYVSTSLGLTPFIDQTRDPVQYGFSGMMNIVGLTVIGAVHESEANYDAMREEISPLVPIKP